jgi:tetratricopeptide (TPR) repeat protein
MWVFPPILYAETVGDLFFQANKFYTEGDFQKAAQRYEDIIASGIVGGNIYYNLGNAYFKLGQKGKAILNYERALKYIPQDEDLFVNLSFVRSLLEEAQPQEQLKWYERIFVAFRDITSHNGWARAVVVFYTLFFLVIIISIFIPTFRKSARYLGVILGLGLILSLVCMKSKVRDLHLLRQGVVVWEEVEVRYSPSFNGATAFRLHEGIKAQIVRYEDQWCQIRLTRDKSGWVEREAIEEI